MATEKKAVAKTKAPKVVSRSRKSAGMRDAIVRAATDIINTKSYALATLTEIAATLDLRDAAIYHYFPNKQALAYACHRHSFERLEQLLTAADLAGKTGDEKLRHFIRHMLVDAAQNGSQLYFGDYTYLDAAHRKIVAAWAERLKNLLVKFLKEGMADGSIVQCEPELVVQLLIGMLIWLAKWAPGVEGLTVDRLMNALDASIFRGLERGNIFVPTKAVASRRTTR